MVICSLFFFENIRNAHSPFRCVKIDTFFFSTSGFVSGEFLNCIGCSFVEDGRKPTPCKDLVLVFDSPSWSHLGMPVLVSNPVSSLSPSSTFPLTPTHWNVHRELSELTRSASTCLVSHSLSLVSSIFSFSFLLRHRLDFSQASKADFSVGYKAACGSDSSAPMGASRSFARSLFVYLETAWATEENKTFVRKDRRPKAKKIEK